jgi:hypothetical protein
VVVEVVIGAGVGAFTLYYYGWRRLQYVRAYWRHRRSATTFERRFREAREALAGSDVPIRVAGDGDATLVQPLRAADAEARAFEAAGFRALGNFVVCGRDGAPALLLRALANATAVAIYSVTISVGRGRWVLVSYGADASYTTRRGPFPHLAEPPFTHAQTLDADVAIAELIDKHRAFAQPGEPIASAEELLATLARSRAMTIAWRAGQPPDVLLDADLRAVLGDAQFAKVGKLWARRLRAELPNATLRRA